MKDEEYSAIVQRLPEIIQSPYDIKGAQYFVWYQGNWVIKQPQPKPSFANGMIRQTLDPQETMDKLEKIKRMNIEWFHIPEIYHNPVRSS